MASADSQTSDLSKEKNQQMLDMEMERRKATFDVTEVLHLVNGGPENTEKRKAIEEILFREPEMRLEKVYECSESERYEMSLARAVKLMQLARKHEWDLEHIQNALRLVRYEAGMMLHTAMFIPALQKLGTEEQRSKWLPLAYGLKIIGTYAQTELGHGTNLQGLETTAEYDVVTREFVLNTPTYSAMKWWPGSLGKTATHVVVLAQLKVGGKKCGMQAFMLQLRSLLDHTPLPGIKVGSIGVRMGLNSADNGFLQLDHVRIPREHMLMRYAQVTEGGQFVSRGKERATYGTMVLVRTNICQWVSDALACATTIGVRYAAVRRQSQPAPGLPEPQILDYQTQQHKLLPVLAASYAFFFTRTEIKRVYDMVNERIEGGDFSLMPELHVQTSGLKAFLSEEGVAGMEALRRSCGGHGFLRASGLPDIYMDVLPTCTLEGENTVLYLQVARYLVKQVGRGGQGEGLLTYLRREGPYACTLSSRTEARDIPLLLEAYQHRALGLLSGAAEKLRVLLQEGRPQHEAWNMTSVQLVHAAKAHVHQSVIEAFLTGLRGAKLSQPTYRVLCQLASLYALHGVIENSGDFLETGSLSREQLDLCREAMLDVMADVRPNAVPLVDAFGVHDGVMASCLGRYDGDVYRALYENALKSPMNASEVHPAYHKYLRPILRRTKSKL